MATKPILTFDEGPTSAQEEKTMTTDWVMVDDEPQHHHRFKNQYARVYDVQFKAGEHSLYHKHDKNTFYVSIYDTKIYDQTYGAPEGHLAELPAGLGMCRGHKDHPLIHQVSNKDNHLMHMIGAEHLSSPDKVSEYPYEHKNFEHIDNPSDGDNVRLYKITLNPGESTGEMDIPFYGLYVVFSDASIQLDDASGTMTIGFSPGNHFWQGPRKFTMTNVGEIQFDCIVGEWL